MKIKIERMDTPCETEISIRCGKHPDEKTKNLILQLEFFVNGIIGYQNEEAHRLSLSDVFYIDCADEKVFLYLEQEVYETHQKLYEWEQLLEDTPFVRTSKSTILNTDKVKSVRPLFGGKMEATMRNGEKQVINRHYIPGFRQKFGI